MQFSQYEIHPSCLPFKTNIFTKAARKLSICCICNFTLRQSLNAVSQNSMRVATSSSSSFDLKKLPNSYLFRLEKMINQIFSTPRSKTETTGNLFRRNRRQNVLIFSLNFSHFGKKVKILDCFQVLTNFLKRSILFEQH